MSKQFIIALIERVGRQGAVARVADWLYRNGCLSYDQACRRAEAMVDKAEEEDGQI